MMAWTLAASNMPAPLLRDLVVILAAAAVVALVLQRLRFATIPAYLITGAIIGPGALAFVSDPANVASISELATVLLLFGVGLHMDLSVLTRGLRQMVLGALLAAVICTLVMWPLCRFLGVTAAGGFVVAAALSMSSTVVVLRVLMQRRELTHPEGRLAFGVLILQDLLAIVFLMLLPPLARWSGTGTAGVILPAHGASKFDLTLNLITNGALAVGGIGMMIGFGRFVLPRLLTEAARARSPEVLIVITTAAALGAAGLTETLIHNAAVGAFLAGFLLSVTPFRHQISGQVGAIRDLFSAVFFTAIGMSVSLAVLVDHWPVIVLGTVVMMLVKGTLMSLSFWATGATGNVALRAGLSLSQSGEFSVLMLASAAAPAIALINDEAVSEAVAVTVLSLIATPSMVQAAARLNEKLPRIPAPSWARREPSIKKAMTTAATDKPLHAIIAGFGLVGRAVADELRRMGATFTVVDLNPATIATQRRLGREILFGDASSVEVLEEAGIHHADFLILTIPDEESVLRACRVARQMKPDVFILARANYVSQGVVAAGLGADGVVVEEMATALEMERALKKVIDSRARRSEIREG
ncbi:MAG: cation:proton antiporter [Phycisphaerae bacterium]|nr:cation:proton antiporter [Phycisphaerae bacterium]